MVVSLTWVEPTHSTGYCWWADAGDCQYRVSRVAGITTRGVDEFRTELGTPDPDGPPGRIWWHSYGASWFPSLDLAQADCQEHAQHLDEVKALMRVEFDPNRYHTPWGGAQHATRYSADVVCYSTASHGGFKVSAAALATMPAHLVNADGWYEEDCEWCKVALAFPSLFTSRDMRIAQWTYDEWCSPEGVARHEAKMAAWQAQTKARAGG